MADNANRTEASHFTVVNDAPVSPPVAAIEGENVLGENEAAGTSSQPLKRIRFTDGWDVLMLKAVVLCNAHVAEHGSSRKKFDEALSVFMSNAPPSQKFGIQAPSWKTIYDRFHKVVATHRSEDREQVAASGISEERTEKRMLLDDIVLAMDEIAERRRAERDEKTANERRLQEAGERIRLQALGSAPTGNETNPETPATPGASPGRCGKRRTKGAASLRTRRGNG